MSKNPGLFLTKKNNHEKITMLTAYDVITARWLDACQIDAILVGDSVGNVCLGYANTLPVTVEDIIYHTKAVCRANPNTVVIADMPFMSYQVSIEKAIENAGRLIKEGGAQAVKIELVSNNTAAIEAIIQAGIPVMAHIGFTPQSVYQLGGYKVQGRDERVYSALKSLAQTLESIGCFSVLLEMVPQTLSEEITQDLAIPTIGIGAGPNCDGQILVTQDLLGLSDTTPPKFVKQYANLNATIKQAISNFKQDVDAGVFPSQEQSYD